MARQKHKDDTPSEAKPKPKPPQAPPPRPPVDGERVPIDTLKPDPANPRKIVGEAADGLATSMETFGDLGGIVFNVRSGELVGGHQRVDQLTEAGAKDFVRTTEEWGYIEHPKTGERFAVRFVDWDHTKQRLANLTANNPHIQGEFGAEALEQLRELEELDGFDELRLNALMEELSKGVEEEDPADGLTDPDDVPEPPPEPVSKLGDIWVLGDHRLMCGDSTIAADVARLMAGEVADWCWTDPPYGVSYVGKTTDALTIENDGSEGLPALLKAAFASVDGVLSDGSPIYIAHPAGPLSLEFAKAMVAVGWKWHETLNWVKDVFVLGHSDYHYRHEPILYGWKGKNRRWYGGRDKDSILEIPRPKRSESHPTMKPVELVEVCLANSSARGSLGFEPFSGSGTTLMAAERLKRRLCAMELDPRFVDVAIARWEAFTGLKATKQD